MSKYKCAECDNAVIVIPGENPVKYCKCDAPIIADMQSELKVEVHLDK